MDFVPTKVCRLAGCGNMFHGNEPRQMQKDLAGSVGTRVAEMENSGIILDGFKLETRSTESRRRARDGDTLSGPEPLRRNHGEQVQSVTLFSHQHIAKHVAVVGGEPRVWRNCSDFP